jgi:hypothetical protein
MRPRGHFFATDASALNRCAESELDEMRTHKDTIFPYDSYTDRKINFLEKNF